MADLIQLRRGTAAQWTAANPVLRNGEPGAETDTKKLKVGDGTTAWNSLAYIGGSGGGIDQLTGAVTAGPGSGSQAATISDGAVTNAKLGDASVTESKIDDGAVTTSKMPNAAVTLAKLADLAADRLIGRGNGSGTGAPQAISLGTGLSLSGTTLSASAAGGPVPGIDPRSSLYVPFTPTGLDDEFDDENFSGWTLVNSGSALANIIETDDKVSLKFPTGGTSQHLQAYMKADTINTGDYIEMCFQGVGYLAATHKFGLIFADGDTWNAGNQVCFAWSPSSSGASIQVFNLTGYNTQVTNTTVSGGNFINGMMIYRFTYTAANTWLAEISTDRTQWATVISTTRTLTPTHCGFFGSTYGAANEYVWSAHYWRKGS